MCLLELWAGVLGSLPTMLTADCELWLLWSACLVVVADDGEVEAATDVWHAITAPVNKTKACRTREQLPRTETGVGGELSVEPKQCDRPSVKKGALHWSNATSGSRSAQATSGLHKMAAAAAAAIKSITFIVTRGITIGIRIVLEDQRRRA